MEIISEIIKSKSFAIFDTFFKNNKLSHAYLILADNEFSGKNFCNALTLKLLCSNNLPCLKCKNCKKFLAGFHPDVLVYPKTKIFLVSDSEDILENSIIKPMESKYKIFIINNFDKSTIQAQNKLLKTLEDAPKNVIFLINAVNQHKILPTIKSRCQVLEIENYCKKDLDKEKDYELIVDMLQNITSSKKIYLYANKFGEKADFDERLSLLLKIFDEILKSKTQKIQDKRLALVGQNYQINAIGEIFELINEAKKMFEANVNPLMITDYLLLKILEVKYLWNKKLQ